eukprot:SAG22_NODE_980_length_6173_cov_5.884261_6_plen_305_part_00
MANSAGDSTSTAAASVAAEPLSLKVKLSYALPRLAVSLFSQHIRGKALKYYTDGEPGMSPATLAMVVSVLKCADLFISMVVGYYSDNCTSKYGRRKPFIAAGAPLWSVAVIGLCLAPGSLSAGATIWYFSFFYFMFFSVGWSLTGVTCKLQRASPISLHALALDFLPYTAVVVVGLDRFCRDRQHRRQIMRIEVGDPKVLRGVHFRLTNWPLPTETDDALAMELTTDYDERASLFGWKAASFFTGVIVFFGFSIVFAATYPNDVHAQIIMPAIVFVVIVLLAFGQMLLIVEEPLRTEVRTCGGL